MVQNFPAWDSQHERQMETENGEEIEKEGGREEGSDGERTREKESFYSICSLDPFIQYILRLIHSQHEQRSILA